MARRKIENIIKQDGSTIKDANGNTINFATSSLRSKFSLENLLGGKGINGNSYKLDRPDGTLIKFPSYGTAELDLLYEHFVKGAITNVGIHESPDPIIPSIVARLCDEASNAEVVFTSNNRNLNYYAAKVLSEAQGGFGGVSSFLKAFTFGYYVRCRQNPIDLIGVSTKSISDLIATGAELVPIGKTGRTNNKYWLRTNDAYTQINLSLDIVPIDMLEPTGNTDWSYWLQRKDDDGNPISILVHRDHIRPVLGQWVGHPQLGTSAIHRLMPYWTNYIVLTYEGNIEQQLNEPSDGVMMVAGAGADMAVEAMYKKQEVDEDNKKINSGLNVISINDPNAKLAKIDWRIPREVNWQEFYQVTSQAFGISTFAYFPVISGVGASGQASIQLRAGENGGVASVLRTLDRFLETLFPKVSLSFQLPNSNQLGDKLEKLKTLADAMNGLNYPDDHKWLLASQYVGIPAPKEIVQVSQTIDNALETEGEEEDTGGDVEQLQSKKRQIELEAIAMEKLNVPAYSGSNNPDDAVDTIFFDETFTELAGMLEAEISQEDKDSDNWIFILALMVYKRGDDVISSIELQNMRDKLAEKAIQKMPEYAKMLDDGIIDTNEWATLVKRLTKQVHETQMLMAIGGINTEYDYDIALKNELNEQYNGIDDLAARIGLGLYSVLQVANFSSGFASGSIGTYEVGNLYYRLQLNGWKRAKWVLDARAEHCNSCLVNSQYGYIPISRMSELWRGQLPARGTDCKNNCRCRVLYK